MAAVVRVKRLLEDEPTGALVLSCKRRKTVPTEEDSVKTVFRFAGTVRDPDEDISNLIFKESKQKLSENTSRPTPKLLEKARKETKLSSQKNRYKLVNFSRALGSEKCKEEEVDVQNHLTVLDVESHPDLKDAVSCESSENACSLKQAGKMYVYDLYYLHPESGEVVIDDLLLDDFASFSSLETELVSDNYRNHRVEGADSDSDAPIADDEDDSNDENNWRNDYPDEEGGSDADDDNLAAGLRKVTFGDEELSSDDDDENLVYSESLDPSDVNLYGSAYALYKKKTLQELHSDAEVNSDSDDCYYSSAHSLNSDECVKDNSG